MEREKGREIIRTSCEYERESCIKVVIKWLYKYHFSLKNLKAMDRLQIIELYLCVEV